MVVGTFASEIDLLIAGSSDAALAAAQTAVRSGLSVVVVDPAPANPGLDPGGLRTIADCLPAFVDPASRRVNLDAVRRFAARCAERCAAARAEEVLATGALRAVGPLRFESARDAAVDGDTSLPRLRFRRAIIAPPPPPIDPGRLLGDGPLVIRGLSARTLEAAALRAALDLPVHLDLDPAPLTALIGPEALAACLALGAPSGVTIGGLPDDAPVLAVVESADFRGIDLGAAGVVIGASGALDVTPEWRTREPRILALPPAGWSGGPAWARPHHDGGAFAQRAGRWAAHLVAGRASPPPESAVPVFIFRPPDPLRGAAAAGALPGSDAAAGGPPTVTGSAGSGALSARVVADAVHGTIEGAIITGCRSADAPLLALAMRTVIDMAGTAGDLAGVLLPAIDHQGATALADAADAAAGLAGG
ncbi:MAG: hypothetical protein KF817_00605 [Phycisphaeraceae bacterium]|nr:hypothetical protein [Phycisphaeraceae bacterium]